MTRTPISHPDQLMLDWESDPAVQARIEELAKRRAEGQAFHWRFRLMVIESVLMGVLVISAGLALNQPAGMVVRSGLAVSAACFGSGMLLIGLSGVVAFAITRVRNRWAR